MAQNLCRGSKTGEDLVQLNQMIKDIEEAVAELSNQIDEPVEILKALKMNEKEKSSL